MSTTRDRVVRLRALGWFVLANMLCGVAVGYGLVGDTASQAGALGWLFLHVAFAAQIALLCLLLGLPLLFLARTRLGGATLMVLGPILFTVLHLFIRLDRIVYSMFHFHINGLALNLVSTPGGFASMRLSYLDAAAFAAACVIGLVLEMVLLRWLLRSARDMPEPPGRLWVAVVSTALVLGVCERAIYAVADLRGATTITRLARAVPLYQPMTVKRLARRFVDVDAAATVTVARGGAASGLDYPRRPLVFDESADTPNIVWIVLDSWRYDAFDAEVTPNIWAFAKDALVFERHHATGNATRFGIFGMFYGLHGSYWHHMLAEQRGPVLVEHLLHRGYRFKVITPSPLTFPEFRRTVFVEVRSAIVDALPGPTLLDRHVQTVETFEAYASGVASDDADGGPFFAFMFFDSTHAPYDFPREHAPFKPYASNVSYATMGMGEKRELIVNRYRNALHYQDLLVRRVLDALEGNGLMATTIVLITGDHGEEFDEHGFWGHNSAFTPQQIHVPLIMRVPGREAARIPWVTSHQDLAPTFLDLLGVRSPPSDFSNGQSLLSPERHVRIVACGWDECSWIHDDGHIIFGTETHRTWGLQVLDADYRPHADARAVLETKSPELAALAGELSVFLKK
jgi:membrane-anchored protein YejM (alkaline phosphatase superfamily)